MEEKEEEKQEKLIVNISNQDISSEETFKIQNSNLIPIQDYPINEIEMTNQNQSNQNQNNQNQINESNSYPSLSI